MSETRWKEERLTRLTRFSSRKHRTQSYLPNYIMKRLAFRIKLPQELRDSALRSSAFQKTGSESTTTLPHYTDAEVYDKINSLFNDSQPVEKKESTIEEVTDVLKDKNSTEEERLDALAKVLANNRNAKYLPEVFITKPYTRSPYEESIAVNNRQRLSVSSIIPYSYCELSKMYQLYMGDQKVSNPLMEKGQEIHRALEVETHPQTNVHLELEYGEKVVDIDELDQSESSKKFRDEMRKALVKERMFSKSKPTVTKNEEIHDPKDAVGLETIGPISEQEVNEVALAKEEELKTRTDPEVVVETVETALPETPERVTTDPVTASDEVISETKVVSEDPKILIPIEIDTSTKEIRAEPIPEIEPKELSTELQPDLKLKLEQKMKINPQTNLQSTILAVEPETATSTIKIVDDSSITLVEDAGTIIPDDVTSVDLDSLIESKADTVSEEDILKLKTDLDISSTQGYKLSQTLNRTLSLLSKGECREILVHGFYNKSTLSLFPPLEQERAEYVNKDIDLEENILLSGIIDDLTLSSVHEGAVETFCAEVDSVLKNSYDLDEIIKEIKKIISIWSDGNDSKNSMINIIVNDDKTTMSTSLPLKSTRTTHMTQVGIYRLLLQKSVEDIELAYLSWRANMKVRSIDVDMPLSSDIITLCALQSNYLLQDFIKLKGGKPMVFEKPDKTAIIPDDGYTFENKSNQDWLDILNGKWVKPPTLSHIIARLVQVQSLLSPLLSDLLQITYISQKSEKLINKVDQKFDEEHIVSQINQGVELWLGRREPAPVTNERSCNYCMFKTKCMVPLRRKGFL